jgi:hypothetical protein
VAAAPFGRLPTFAQYLEWASKIGCTVKYGIATAADGSPSRVIMIEDSAGLLWVHVTEIKEGDILLPTQIANLDRRLHVKSPFFSLDVP